MNVPRLLPRSHPVMVGRHTSAILNEQEMEQLSLALPPSVRAFSLLRVFTTAVDGVSFFTFFARSQSTCGAIARPSLLLIRDSFRCRFGFFCPVPLLPHPTFFGTTQCFLFDFAPNLRVFRSTRSDARFVKCTNSSITIGFGGHPALYFASDLSEGTGYPCTTFSNPRLSHEEKFSTSIVELWIAISPLDVHKIHIPS